MSDIDFKSKEFTEFNTALLLTLTRYRDVSVRDGNQSLDANKWTIDQVTTVLKEENNFALLLKEIAKNVTKEGLQEALKSEPDHLLNHFFNKHPDANVEDAVKWHAQTIGGGCFLQNARFLGEEPFSNMEKMAAAAPDVVKFDLDRGGQLYAMVLNNRETQKVVREEMVACGLNDKKVFDMMNDLDNFTKASEINAQIKQKQREEGVPEHKLMQVAGAISVIGPNSEGVMAIPLERRGKQAVDLVKAGYDDIYIKDYAGQFRTTEESLALAKAIHEALKDAFDKGEIDKMPKVFWHSHGHKPEVLKALLDSGYVQQVDVAIGDLSGASSHTNMRDLFTLEMKARGFDLNDDKYKDHPVIKQFNEIEYNVNEISKVHKKFRVANVVSDEEVYDSKIAGGAVSALWALINRNWNNVSAQLQNITGTEDERKKLVLKETLKTNPKVWDAAGQFETVTPGATIAYDMALTETMSLLKKAVDNTVKRMAEGTDVSILKHTPQYKDIVKGRWGYHTAIEEGYFKDKGLRTAYLAMDTIKTFEAAIKVNESVKPAFNKFMNDIGIKPQEFNSSNPDLEKQLRSLNTRSVSNAINNLKGSVPYALHESLKYEFSTSKFKEVPEGMQYALNEVEKLCTANNIEMSDKSRDRWAKVILGCRSNDKGFDIGKTLFTHLVINKGVGKTGEIESERFGDIETLLKDSKAYGDFVKFKSGTTEVKEFLKEQGYGTDKKPAVVYGTERMERFMNTKFFEMTEKDIIRNLIVYAQKRISPVDLTGVSRFSGRNIEKRKLVENIMEKPVAPVWHELKKAVSAFSDDIMQIIIKPENKKQILAGVEKVKDRIAEKIASYYSYSSTGRKQHFGTASIEWTKRGSVKDRSKEWDGIVREG